MKEKALGKNNPFNKTLGKWTTASFLERSLQ